MANWMDTPVIMEGVETRQQVEFLRDIGCGYVQGYYYARPMTVPAYEALVEGVEQSPVELRSENLEQISRIVWSASPEIELLFNSMEQPAAVCELENGRIRTMLINTSFHRLFGYSAWFDSDVLRDRREAVLSPETMEEILRAFRAAAGSGGSARCVFPLPGQSREVVMSLKYWGKSETSQVFLAQFREPGGSAR